MSDRIIWKETVKEAAKKKQGFLKSIIVFFTLRKIQLDIVSVFIILMSLFSLFLIVFTYSRNSKAILEISNLTMKEASEGLLDKIKNITTNAEFLAQASQAFVEKSTDVSYDNKELVRFILDILRYNKDISTVKITTPEGNLLAVVNMSLSKEIMSYYNNPSKPLPEGVVYALRYVENLQGVFTETWQYLNKDLEILDKEVISPTSYDSRKEPWYSDTIKIQKLHWSNAYLNTLGEQGLTVAAPALNTEGNLSAVIALNLSLNLLTDFFLHQHVGSSGDSFILDKDGQIILPPVKELINLPQARRLYMIPGIFQQFVRSGQNNFVFEEDQTKYLIFISAFPLHLEKKWNVLFMVPFDEFFHSIVETQKKIIIISIIATIIFGFFIYFSSKHIGGPIVKLALDVRKIQNFDFSESSKLKSQIVEIIELDNSINSMRKALRSFGRYVPKEIVQVLIEQGREIAVGGEKKDVTVFFSDIADFTTFSENTLVENLLEELTKYFEVFSKIIIKFDGTIDKYIGDCVMAMWNAPQQVVDHPDKACLSALHCLISSRKQQNQPGSPGWKTRFGLHTGEVVVGNIGTNERMNYTVIGDVVNTTSRLHGVNKIFDTSIIISETLQRKIGTQFLTRPLDTVFVKGKKNQITVYELVGLLKGEEEYLATQQQIELCHAFAIAYERFREGRIEEAKEHFLNVLKQFPEDKPTQIYLEKIQTLKG